MQFMRLGLEFILDNQNLCWMLWCATKASMDFKHRLLPFSILITCLANWLLVILSSLHEHGIINFLNSWPFHSVILMIIYTVITNINREMHKICLCDTPGFETKRSLLTVLELVKSDTGALMVCRSDGIPFTSSISTCQYLLSKHTDWQIDFLSTFKRNGDH